MNLAMAHLHLIYLGEVLLLRLLDEAAHCGTLIERLALEVLQRRRDVEFLDDSLELL